MSSFIGIVYGYVVIFIIFIMWWVYDIIKEEKKHE